MAAAKPPSWRGRDAAREESSHLASFGAPASGLHVDSISSERVRLAHELHDGLLQSLASIALQFEVLCRLAEHHPKLLRERLLEIRQLIAEEQQDLRAWIENALDDSCAPRTCKVDLAARLKKLCNRVSRWSVHATLVTQGVEAIPAHLVDHVYRLIDEALSNVTRHARASDARVDITVSPGAVRVVIEDNGCGFPFRGRLDLAQLTHRALGPASLKERVQALAGELVLTSSLSGSRIEITLPYVLGHGAGTRIDRESA